MKINIISVAIFACTDKFCISTPSIIICFLIGYIIDIFLTVSYDFPFAIIIEIQNRCCFVIAPDITIPFIIIYSF